MSEEYINRELLENAFEDENKNGNFVFTANWIMEIVDNLPTADVVPKSEVAIEIIQDIAKACAPHDHHLNSLDFEIGYITAMNQVIAQLEEIKKKYTEEHT
jgi:hypothetical protein